VKNSANSASVLEGFILSTGYVLFVAIFFPVLLPGRNKKNLGLSPRIVLFQ